MKILKILFSYKSLVCIATIGVWVLVLQNFGVIPTTVQSVWVENTIDANVTGNVDAEVTGCVDVKNTVDINVSEINGYSNCFYDNSSRHPHKYYRIPVFDGR